MLKSNRCANPGLSSCASPDSLHSEQTPVHEHVTGKSRRMSRRSSKCGLNASSIAPYHAPNERSKRQLRRDNALRKAVSALTSSTEARAQGAESDSEGRGEPRRTGKPRLPPVEHSGCGRLRNTQTRPPTRDSSLSRSPPPKRMPERSGPAIHSEPGTVSTSNNTSSKRQSTLTTVNGFSDGQEAVLDGSDPRAHLRLRFSPGQQSRARACDATTLSYDDSLSSKVSHAPCTVD